MLACLGDAVDPCVQKMKFRSHVSTPCVAMPYLDLSAACRKCAHAFRSASRVQSRCAIALILFALYTSSYADYVTFPFSPADAKIAFDRIASTARNAPVGTVLAASDAAPSLAAETGCNVTRTITVAGVLASNVSTNIPTYQTNVAGVGVRYQVTGAWNESWKVPKTETLPPYSSTNQNWFIRAELVVTGPVGSGAVTNLPSMTFSFTGPCIKPVTAIIPTTTTANSVVAARGCTVATPNISVAFPDVPVSTFSTIGSTGPAKPFQIQVSCGANVNAFVTLTDATDPTNVSDTLSLTPTSSAKGIGIAIFDAQNNRLSFGPSSATQGNVHQFSLGSTSTAPDTVTASLTARYVRTGNITAGPANSQAILTMSYQ